MSRAQYIRKFGIPILIVALVIEIAVSGAYGVMASQGGETRSVAPEQVLTALDLKELTGQEFKMEAVAPTPGQNFDQCTYTAPKGVLRIGVVQAVPADDPKRAADRPEVFFNNLKETMGKTESLKNLGQDNLVAGNQLLVVLQSGRMLAISYQGDLNPEQQKKLLGSFGKRAVQNLNRMAYPAE